MSDDRRSRWFLAPLPLRTPRGGSVGWELRYGMAAGVAGAILAAVPYTAAIAQPADFPNKAIRLIVPYGPGGVSDLMGRVLATAMTKSLGQTVFVDNRSGGGGTIGAASVATSAPDGYTILLTSPPMVAVAPMLLPGLKYNAVEDFTPIGTLVVTPNILVVNPSLPIRTMGDIVAYAKGPGKGKLSFASSGPGSTGHLSGHILKTTMGVEMTHIPYASGNVFPDVIAGRVSMAFDSMPSTIGYIQSGRVRPVAVMSETRSAMLPDVPTAAESGFPAATLKFWMGVEGPANMPPAIVAKLNGAIRDAVSSAAMREQLTALGAEPFVTSPQEFDKLRRADTEKLRRLVKEMGLGSD